MGQIEGDFYEETDLSMMQKSNGIRPIVLLNANARVYLDVNRYFLAEHEHQYTAKIMNEQTLCQKGDCSHNDVYYYSCEFCDSVSADKTFEDENSYRHINMSEIVSDETFCGYENEVLKIGRYYYTCADCGQIIKQPTKNTNATYFTAIVPHEHRMELYKTTEPTCTKDGVKIYRCYYCLEYKISEVYAPKLNHDPKKVPDSKALCSYDEGSQVYRYYYTCARCGAVLNDDELGEEAPTFEFEGAHEHAFRFVGEYEPTCTEKGYKLYECEICGEAKYEYTADALKHDYVFRNRSSRDYAKYCTTKDYYTCTRCGDVNSITAPHEYTKQDGSLYEAANCTHANIYYLQCKYCGDKNREYTYEQGEKKEHELIKDISDAALKTAATDTENAIYYYTCKTCGKVIKDGYTFEYIPGDGEHYHHFELTQSVEPKCGGARTIHGKKVYTCACGETYKILIEPIAHTKPATVYHFPQTCLSGEVEQYECAVCGETVIERKTQPLTHDFTVIGEIKKAATCYSEEQYELLCSHCGIVSPTQVYTQPNSKLPHRCELVQTIQPSCEEEGKYIYKCKNCSASYTEYFGQPTGHAYELSETLEPTCTQSGINIYHCKYCDHEKSEEFGEALGHTGTYVRSELETQRTGLYRCDYYLCSRCGETYTELVMHKHVYDLRSDVVAKKESCHNNTIMYYVCSDCFAHGMKVSNTAYTYEIEGTKKDHVPMREANEAALRTPKTGNSPATYYYTCGRCGDVLKEGAYANTYFSTGDVHHEHTYFCEELQRVDCMNDGILRYTCTICGYSYDGVYQVAGGSHNYYRKINFKGDCTTRAYDIYYCRNCNDVKLEYTSDTAPGHDYSVKSDKVYKAATCTDDALYYLACSRCGEVSDDHIYAKENTAFGLEHVKAKVISLDTLRSKENAGEQATYYYTCSHCGDILKGEEYGFFSPDLNDKPIGDYPLCTSFTMGRWPQTKITDTQLIEELNSFTPQMYQYGYGYGNEEVLKRIDERTDYSYQRFAEYLDMSYGDIVFGGEKYRKVVVNHARVEDCWEEPDALRDEQLCGTYYFRWDPIEWIVYNSQDGMTYAVSDVILDYAYIMRENENDADWLHECLFANAFTQSEKNILGANKCFYLTKDDVRSCKNTLMRAQTGILAPVSAYAQLNASNLSLANTDSSDIAMGKWVCVDAQTNERYSVSQEMKYRKVSSLSQLEEIGIRPAIALNDAYVPTGAQPADTCCTHEHLYIRKMITEDTIVKASGGEIYDDYLYSCICCNAYSQQHSETICSDALFSYCDVNRDGIVDIADVSLIITYIGYNADGIERYDLNANGVIDTQDISLMLLSGEYG